MAFVSGSLERHRAMAILALQPNTLGAALAMYLPLFAVFSSNKISTRAAQLWFVFCTAVTAFALLLTLSRGSWMGLAAALIAIGLFRDRKILVFILLAAATHTFWAPQEAVDRVSETTQFNEDLAADDQMFEGSAQMRVEQYKSLGTMMAPRPILGWGYRSYPKVFEKLGTLKRTKGAHSSYCQLGTEGGVVGLAALVAVLGAMMWTGWRGARVTTDPFHRWIGVAVMAGALSMAVSMITGARFEPQKIFAFFWVLAGIVERETVLALLARPAAALMTVGNRPEEAR
jgi:O-antigen ligase